MNVYKILNCDIKEGIFKNKRFIIVPFLFAFECIYADIKIGAYKSYFKIQGEITFWELISEIFHGCDPISNSRNADIKIELPYFWIAFFVFAIFMSFDYMRDDLSNFGIQIISRTGNRRKWWFSKCIWCVLSGIWFYIIFILIAMIYSLLNNYNLSFPENFQLINLLANRSVIYSFIGVNEASTFQIINIILAPMFVICTLNILQMTISLFVKPMFSYLIVLGVLMLGVISDKVYAFSRYSMITFSGLFYEDGYNLMAGFLTCFILIMITTLTGYIYIKKYNILSDRE